jgi:hypothetical protein
MALMTALMMALMTALRLPSRRGRREKVSTTTARAVRVRGVTLPTQRLGRGSAQQSGYRTRNRPPLRGALGMMSTITIITARRGRGTRRAGCTRLLPPRHRVGSVTTVIVQMNIVNIEPNSLYRTRHRRAGAQANVNVTADNTIMLDGMCRGEAQAMWAF